MLPATAQTDSSINKTDSLKKYADATTKNVSGDSEVIKPAAVSPVPQNQSTKPQVFNSGFIDFQNSGQMNASARVMF